MNDPERGEGGSTDYLYDDWSDNDEGREMNENTLRETAEKIIEGVPISYRDGDEEAGRERTLRWLVMVLQEFVDGDELKRIHGEEPCHICGKPRWDKGGMACSYPHGRLPKSPANPEHPEGFWTWEKPAERGEQSERERCIKDWVENKMDGLDMPPKPNETKAVIERLREYASTGVRRTDLDDDILTVCNAAEQRDDLLAKIDSKREWWIAENNFVAYGTREAAIEIARAKTPIHVIEASERGEADTKRLDWLDNSRRQPLFHNGRWYIGISGADGGHLDLRIAIDAAMKEEK